jgi:hypothetical protein
MLLGISVVFGAFSCELMIKLYASSYRRYAPDLAYAHSKFANILFTQELAQVSGIIVDGTQETSLFLDCALF